MMGERAVSRAALEAGNSAFPMVGERALCSVTFEVSGGALPAMGSVHGAAEPPWPAAAPSYNREVHVVPHDLLGVWRWACVAGGSVFP